MLMFGDAMSIFARSTCAAVGELARAHAAEEVEVLADRARAVRTVPARLGERASIVTNLVGGQAVDVREARRDELLGALIQLFEIVRREVQPVVPREPQPPDVVLDRLDVLDVLGNGIGVVEAQVAGAAEIACDAEVQANRLGMADVQVPVGLGRKPRGDTTAVFTGRVVGGDDLPDEVEALGGAGRRQGHPVIMTPGVVLRNYRANPSGTVFAQNYSRRHFDQNPTRRPATTWFVLMAVVSVKMRA